MLPLEEHFRTNAPGLFVCLELYLGIFIAHFASKKNSSMLHGLLDWHLTKAAG